MIQFRVDGGNNELVNRWIKLQNLVKRHDRQLEGGDRSEGYHPLENVGPSVLVIKLDAWSKRVDLSSPEIERFKHSYIALVFCFPHGSTRLRRAVSRVAAVML